MTQARRFPGSVVVSLPRRDFLKFGVASVALLMPWEAHAATPVKTKARIVIVGAGPPGFPPRRACRGCWMARRSP